MSRKPSKKPIIAITLGDPGGIGPEVTIKALSRLHNEALSKRVNMLLIGPQDLYEYWIERTKSKLKLKPLLFFDDSKFERGVVHIIDIGTALPFIRVKASQTCSFFAIPDSFEKGRISKKNAFLAFGSLRIGAYLAACGKIDALVTSPINKEAMRLIEPKFCGHTEYLANVSKTKEYAMMFDAVFGKTGYAECVMARSIKKSDAGSLRVILATTHVSHSKVHGLLSKKLIQSKIKLTNEYIYKFYGIKKPKIAVCALNPHGREFGGEEDKIILPAINSMRKKGISAIGPLPGDTVFHGAFIGDYDAVIAMYHDQGLAPLKTIAFDNAVNITVGLPFIRTSPDHGTAFNIAYKGNANELSMLRAVCRAIQFSVVS